MNMRQHKNFIQGKIWLGLRITRENAYWQGVIDRALALSPEEQAAVDARNRALVDQLFKDIGMVADPVAVEAARVEFVCERVKDGVVVDTFDTREDALALLQKHARSKKAKLQVRNSGTGELELFSTEEMFA